MTESKTSFKGAFQGSTSLLAIAGASLYWLWMDAAVFSHTLRGLASQDHDEIAMFILVTLVSVLSFVPLLRHRWPESLLDAKCRPAVAALMACGTVGSLALVGSGAWDSTGLLLVGSIMSGVFFSFFNLMWGWVCVAQGHAKAILHISAAWALTLPFNLVFAMLPPLVSGVFVSLLPLVSGGLFLTLGMLQEKPSIRIDVPSFNKVPVIEERNMAMGVDVRLLLLVVVFCSVFGLMYSTEVFSAGADQAVGLSVVGVRAVTALFYFVGVLTVLQDRVKSIFKVCFYILVAGLAIMLMGLFVPDMGALSGQLVAVGYCGFDILVWTMVAFHGYVSPNQPQRTVAVAMLAEQLGILLGAVLGMVVELVEPDVSTVAVMMVCLNISAIAVLVAYTEYGSQMWGLLVKTSLRGDEAFEAKTDELGAFKASHKLTEREGDVLALIIQGRSYGHIAEKMFVSENTVKTHVRHIFSKCGVRGKQELIDLVEQERKRQGPAA